MRNHFCSVFLILLVGLILLGCDNGGGGDNYLSESAPIYWGTPELISDINPDIHVSFSEIALNAKGNAFLLWEQFQNFISSNIYACRYMPETGWGEVEEIDDLALHADCPEIAVNNDGYAIAVWLQCNDGDTCWDDVFSSDYNPGTGKNIYACRYVPGAGWGEAEMISNGIYDADWPEIAINNDGYAIAVWQQFNGSLCHISACRYIPETGWGTAEDIDDGDSSGYPMMPMMAINNNGYSIVLWKKFDGTHLNIYANHSEPEAGWGKAEMISNGDCCDYEFPQIALNNNGYAIAVWEQCDDTSQNIYASRYIPGTGWDSAQLISNPDIYAYFPEIVLNDNGFAIVVWEESYDFTDNDIYACCYMPETGWGKAEKLNDPNDISNGSPLLALNNDGYAIALWEQYDDHIQNFSACRYIPGTGWSKVEKIDARGAGIIRSIALNNNEKYAFAVWDELDETSSFRNIYANKLYLW